MKKILFLFAFFALILSSCLSPDHFKEEVNKYYVTYMLNGDVYDKVLVKYHKNGCWVPTMLSYIDDVAIYTIDKEDSPVYIIPYENNEHLAAKYDDPDPYYITW